MKNIIPIAILLGISSSSAWPQQAEQSAENPIHIDQGGHRYNNRWQTTKNTQNPDTDHASRNEQPSNIPKGHVTIRCKECCGRGYRHNDGANRGGSLGTRLKGMTEATGAIGVMMIEGPLEGRIHEQKDCFRAVWCRTYCRSHFLLRKRLRLKPVSLRTDTENSPAMILATGRLNERL